MQKNILHHMETYTKRNQQRRIWQKIVRLLGCAVVFCTTYSLILPAITMENTSCGLEEHSHNMDCYRKIDTVEPEVSLNLLCTMESLGIHVHDESCYDAEENIVCGFADYVAHEHLDLCYDGAGNLICSLPEVILHVHTEDCYLDVQNSEAASHTHTAACYSYEKSQLICTEPEVQGHIHDADCYPDGQFAETLIDESDKIEIFDESSAPVCGLMEVEGHRHDDSCYVQIEVLSCGNDDITSSGESALICDKPEVRLHIHEGSCFETYIDEDNQEITELVCTEKEIREHVHTEKCLGTVVTAEDDSDLTCTIPEGDEHKHTELCYGTWQLICELPEHVHEEACELQKETEKDTINIEETESETAISETETEVGTEISETESEQESSSEVQTEFETEGISEEPESKAETSASSEETESEAMTEAASEEAESGTVTDVPGEESEDKIQTEALSEESEDETQTEALSEESEDEAQTEVSGEKSEDEMQTEALSEESESETQTEVTDEESETETELSSEMSVCDVETEFEAESEVTDTENETLACGLTEHAHTDACYEESELVCEQVEHTHTLSCYADATADVETAEVWEEILSSVELTGDWAVDVVAIAKSQLGYTESKANYIVGEDGETTYGYTRYGMWYGDPYGDWCAMFVSFCLNYAEVQGIPFESACDRWITALSAENVDLYRAAEEYEPTAGDLVFFEQKERIAGADHVGIVAEVIPAAETESAKLVVIEGNSSDMVKAVTYAANDESILGYADLHAAQNKCGVQAGTTHTAQVSGEDYTITVTYSDLAQIPDAARLTAAEILPGDERYDIYLSQIKDELNILDNGTTAAEGLIDESVDISSVLKTSSDTVTGIPETYSLPLAEDELVEEVAEADIAEESESEAAEETEAYTGLKYFRAFDIAFEADGAEVTPEEVVEVKVELADTITYDYSWETAQFAENGTGTAAAVTDDVSETGSTTLTYSTENLSDTAVYSNFSEEDLAKVQAVIDMIDALPSSEEAEEVLAEYESLGDMKAYEEYYTSVGQEARRVYARYEELGEELQPLVTNIDKLMDLAWLWSMVTLLDDIESDAPTTVNAASTSEFIELNLYDYGSNINEKYNSKKTIYPGFQWNGGAYHNSGYSRQKIDYIDFGNSMITDFDYISSSSSSDGNGKSSNAQNITSGGTGINAIDNTDYGVTNRPIGLSTGEEVLKRTLGSDGYPVLIGGQSLSYLFNSSEGYADKQNTASIDGLFQRKPDSWAYYYNSRENHAQYDYNNGFTLFKQIITPNFITYPFGNFLPLNDITDGSTATQVGKITKLGSNGYLQNIINRLLKGSEDSTEQQLIDMLAMYRNNLQGGDYTTNTNDPWATWSAKNAIYDYFTGDGDNPSDNVGFLTDAHLNNLYNIDFDVDTNFFFGMDMSMNFMQPKGGMTGNDTNKDGESDYPMEFYFTGDDDVWVYIDGVLFLDLSGIHRHVGGEIDFVNGKVHYYYLDTANTGDVSTTPYKTYTFTEILSAAGKKTDGLNANGTFKDYTTHQFKFFYMERGSGSSVCRLNFNFPLLKQNSISIGKEITSSDADIEAIGNPDYKFQVLKADSDGTKTSDLFIAAGTTYTIYDANDNPIGTGTTDSNGVITLKAGQRAEFTGIKENSGKYYVRELLDDITVDQYDNITVSGESTTTSENVTVGNDTFTGADSLVKDVADGSTSFRFTNKYDSAKLGKLEIAKVLEDYQLTRAITEFQVSVKLDDEDIPAGTKYVVEGEAEAREVTSAGIVTIPAGAKITISNILAGTSFTVEETTNSALGYTVSYSKAEGENDEDITVSGSSVSGIIKTGVSIGIIVTNTEKGDSIELPVTKTILNPDGTEYTFDFRLLQVTDQTGNELADPRIQKDLSLNVSGDRVGQKFVLNYLAKDLPEIAGDYYYKIAEVKGTDSKVRYDDTVYVVKVTVEESESQEGITADITGAWKNGEAITDLEALSFDFNNTLLRDLTLTKKVAGIESTSAYTFEIALKAGSAPLPETITANISNGTEVQFKAGKATISLKNTESVVIPNLPYGVIWTITEINTDGYHVSWEISDSNDNKKVEEDTEVTGQLNQDLSIICVNAASYELPETGGPGTAWYTLAGLALLTCAAYLWCIKVKRGKEGSA